VPIGWGRTLPAQDFTPGNPSTAPALEFFFFSFSATQGVEERRAGEKFISVARHGDLEKVAHMVRFALRT
jgi:hypothetical protein